MDHLVGALRELAKRFGLSPKGGFRIERAGKSVLAPLVADPEKPELLRAVCELLVERTGDAPAEPSGERSDSARSSILRLKEQELAAARAARARSQEQVARLRRGEAERTRRLRREEERATRLKAEVERLQRALERTGEGRTPADEARRIHELERDLDALGEVEEGLRRLLALRAARVRELEVQVAELEAEVPKGRRKRLPPPEAPPLAEGFRLPHFTPSFYRSLIGKSRRSVEKAMQAGLLFCTEGPGYPGLEAKPIEGQELWSLRASLKLRVYFRIREDGDVDFLALADREDQHTTLRRLKERSP